VGSFELGEDGEIYGVSNRLFSMSLKKLEFRYNNRREKELYEDTLKVLRMDQIE